MPHLWVYRPSLISHQTSMFMADWSSMTRRMLSCMSGLLPSSATESFWLVSRRNHWTPFHSGLGSCDCPFEHKAVITLYSGDDDNADPNGIGNKVPHPFGDFCPDTDPFRWLVRLDQEKLPSTEKLRAPLGRDLPPPFRLVLSHFLLLFYWLFLRWDHIYSYRGHWVGSWRCGCFRIDWFSCLPGRVNSLRVGWLLRE